MRPGNDFFRGIGLAFLLSIPFWILVYLLIRL